MATVTSTPARTAAMRGITHVFLVAEENHGFNSVIGDPNMPYCCAGSSSLQVLNGLAVNFFADSHPSIGNYFMVTDGIVESNDDSQTPSSLAVSHLNLFRSLINAGQSWKVYAENLPSVGYTGGDSGEYAVRHNPAVYYTDVQGTSQANNVVPFEDPNVGLAADMAKHSLPKFAMIVPNLLDDEHDGTDIQADQWLQANIQLLLDDPDFANGGVLAIWFDEGDDNACSPPDNGSSCGGQVAFILVGKGVKPGYQGTKHYQHAGAERFIYDALGLGTAPGAGATANDMSDFFDPPSPTPVASATTALPPTPIATPSATPTVVAASAGQFFVAPTGNDGNNGSAASPWITIQHAAQMLVPGQAGVVLAGSYPERVSITTSGTTAKPITLQAASGAGVKMQGFDISGSNWIVNGFDVSVQSNSTSNGIHVTGSASNDTIANNYVHETCLDGIQIDPSTSNVSILSNRVWRATTSGIRVEGTGHLVSGNEIWGTIQNTAAVPSLANCSNPNDDADGIRFFAADTDIAQNYIHDINDGSAEVPNAHTDCFQTWGTPALSVTNITIERNLCHFPVGGDGSYFGTGNHSSEIESLNGPVGNITYRNNVFINMGLGIDVGSGVGDMTIVNNTFAYIWSDAVDFHKGASASDQVINNVFFNVGSNNDAYMECEGGGAPTWATNDHFMQSGSPGTFNVSCSSSPPNVDLDPGFMNNGDSSGAGSDLHLLAGSAVINKGTTLPAVPNDHDGIPRPAGSYSIGAYQQ